MKDWTLYNEDQQTNIKDTNANLIVKALPQIYSPYVSKLKASPTNKIKFVLLKLGYQLGYCGYASLGETEAALKLKALLNKDLKAIREKFKFGTHKFRNTEWHYDIHWYRDKDNSHFMPKDLYMACESELHPRRTLKKGEKEKGKYYRPGVRYDFEKLLVSNALLRVMIFKVDKLHELEHSKYGLANYFTQAIEAYNQLLPGSKFLFMCLHGQDLHYQYYEKKGLTTG